MNHAADADQPQHGPEHGPADLTPESTPKAPTTADAPARSTPPDSDLTTDDLHSRVTDVALPAALRFERQRKRRWAPSRGRRLGPMRTTMRTSALFLGAALLIAVMLGALGLGLQQWAAFGLAAAPKPTAADIRAPVATPSPVPTAAPTPTPDPTLKLNAAMGCADGAPSPASQVIYGAKNFQTGGPPPNEIALTFDDGPTPFTSPPILDYLEQTHTPATFFVMGQYARAWPDLIQREWRDGFAIGVHTWDHPSMPFVPDSQMPHQFGDTLMAIHDAIGADACIWFWRPPYGDHNARVIGFAQRFGLTTINWNDDPRDWSRPGPQTIAGTLLAEARPGAIVVMHDGPAHREQTAAALPLILAGLRARGLTPVTIPRLLADGHYPGVNTTLRHQHAPPDVP